MKKSVYKCFSFIAVILISCTAMAQSDTNSAKPFKEIHKTQETDRHLEKEIKKKELQKAPSQIISANDTTALKMTKKEKCRRKKKLY